MSVKKIKRINHEALFKKRTAKDNNTELSHRIIIEARKSGELNLSFKGLSTSIKFISQIN